MSSIRWRARSRCETFAGRFSTGNSPLAPARGKGPRVSPAVCPGNLQRSTNAKTCCLQPLRSDAAYSQQVFLLWRCDHGFSPGRFRAGCAVVSVSTCPPTASCFFTVTLRPLRLSRAFSGGMCECLPWQGEVARSAGEVFARGSAARSQASPERGGASAGGGEVPLSCGRSRSFQSGGG
jgi:hypothetical protein